MNPTTSPPPGAPQRLAVHRHHLPGHLPRQPPPQQPVENIGINGLQRIVPSPLLSGQDRPHYQGAQVLRRHLECGLARDCRPRDVLVHVPMVSQKGGKRQSPCQVLGLPVPSTTLTKPGVCPCAVAYDRATCAGGRYLGRACARGCPNERVHVGTRSSVVSPSAPGTYLPLDFCGSVQRGLFCLVLHRLPCGSVSGPHSLLWDYASKGKEGTGWLSANKKHGAYVGLPGVPRGGICASSCAGCRIAAGLSSGPGNM